MATSGTPIPKFEFDPDGKVPFPIDWAPWLTSQGDGTIVSSDWFSDDTEVSLSSDSFDDTSTEAFVELTDAEVGKTYEFTNRITTSNGRRWDQSIRIKAKQR